MDFTRNRFVFLSTHTLGWLGLYLLVYLGFNQPFFSKATWWVAGLTLFYLHIFWLVPCYLQKRRWLTYLAVTALFLITLSAAEVTVDVLLHLLPGGPDHALPGLLLFFAGFAFLKAVLVLPLSFGYLFLWNLLIRKQMTRYLEIAIHILIAGALYGRAMLLPPWWNPETDPFRFLFKAATTAAFIGFDLSFFYLNVFWLIPQLLIPKRYGRYAVSLIILFVLTVSLEYAMYHLPIYTPAQTARLVQGIAGDALGKGVVLLLSFFYQFTKDWFRHERLQQQLRTEKAVAELNVLRVQLHPHFLFNTLNNIYVMAMREESPKTVESLGKLGRMMHYMLDDCQQERVPLEKELAYLENFVQLQRLRFSSESHFPIAFSVTGDTTGLVIVPMLLIPFVENAFKHGVSIRSPSFITISIRMEQTLFHLEVRNSWHPDKQIPQRVGIGLRNVEQLLALNYPDKHLLQQQQSEGIYEVRLQIQLHFS